MTGKREEKRRKKRDSRVTAPMISWQMVLAILGIMVILVILVILQSFIFDAYRDRLAAMVGVLTYYLICVCVLLAVLVWLVWRRLMGKPLRKIAQAARRVAQGDFSVQVDSGKRGGKRAGKKNEIDVLIDDFNTMTRELAGNEMLKSDFIANVSHEIKTPLSIIQSYTKALKDGCVTADQQEQYMDTVLDAAEKLNSMITNILKLSKLENQQIFPWPETYQLGEQLRRCALNYMEKWQAKDIAFVIDVADVAVHYDASLMELVWNNLLSNAVKFTDPGGRIALTSRVEGGVIAVQIQDSGCGMDQETCSRIFEKFYQGDTSHASEGNGLGLALAKKVVDIAGGRILVESSPGKGTAVTVELKL
ncbi:MAG TPA: HAMP domain-containing histidine kinase [Candidatus Egerieimonas intestinavium]|uniref:histidine kinase n=1 Tax=Candidatus Egerieimonas intestinavium TaxID=2840777 RepID=A0A9D1JFN2_9FIRM|nr:HAMP domain-containing histidine kinase [Candidatus Egerieimonas intestinavium]